MSTYAGTEARPGSVRCDIRHGFGDQRCVRAPGHAGHCRSRVYRDATTGRLSWSLWHSAGGRFKDHWAYREFTPPNAAPSSPESGT